MMKLDSLGERSPIVCDLTLLMAAIDAKDIVGARLLNQFLSKRREKKEAASKRSETCAVLNRYADGATLLIRAVQRCTKRGGNELVDIALENTDLRVVEQKDLANALESVLELNNADVVSAVCQHHADAWGEHCNFQPIINGAGNCHAHASVFNEAWKTENE